MRHYGGVDLGKLAGSPKTSRWTEMENPAARSFQPDPREWTKIPRSGRPDAGTVPIVDRLV